jgi:hypothetical protein
MNNSIFSVGAIAILVLGLGAFAVTKVKKQANLRKKYPGYPKGYWMNQGMSLGIAIGAGIGIVFGYLPIGIGIGVAIGVAIGAQQEKQHEDEIRPITDEERKLKQQTILVSVGTLLFGVIVFAIRAMLGN